MNSVLWLYAFLGILLTPMCDSVDEHHRENLQIDTNSNRNTNQQVTSISADTHKYGFAPKGSSVILYRDMKVPSQVSSSPLSLLSSPSSPSSLSTLVPGAPVVLLPRLAWRHICDSHNRWWVENENETVGERVMSKMNQHELIILIIICPSPTVMTYNASAKDHYLQCIGNELKGGCWLLVNIQANIYN